MRNLSNGCKFTKVADYASANTSAINSASVDMAGFEGVVFLTSLGTANSSNTINAAQSADDSSFADLANTSVTSGSSDEDLWIDVFQPSDRYVRCEVVRSGASTTCESIWAIQYGARKVPQDNTTTGTIAGELHVGEAEGTA